MMKKLGIAAGVLAALLLGLVGFAMTKPDTYHVERSRTYAASPEAVWALVSDMNQFPSWSPWQKYDPAMKTTIEGAAGAVGHTYSWKGNSDAGSGSMKITAVKPGERIDIALHFLEPFEDQASTAYILAADGDKTRLTWSMDGKNNMMGKIFSVFMDMETMIGKDYEEGLANLEAVLAKKG